MKLKRKFTRPESFVGQVGAHMRYATGRTKREATKRIRHLFAMDGIQTSNALEDHLVVCRATVHSALAKAKVLRPRKRPEPELVDA